MTIEGSLSRIATIFSKRSLLIIALLGSKMILTSCVQVSDREYFDPNKQQAQVEPTPEDMSTFLDPGYQKDPEE